MGPDYIIRQLHRDEYGHVLWTTDYGPYQTRSQAEALAQEFREDYGYECVVQPTIPSHLN